MKILIGGQPWTIRMVPRGHALLEEDADEFDVDGRTYIDRCLIVIRRGLSRGAFEDVLVHELLHAAFGVAGAHRFLTDEDCEENLVRALTPLLHRLFRDLGFKLPDVGQRRTKKRSRRRIR